MKKKNVNFLPNIDPRIYASFGIILLLSFLFLLYQYFRHVDCENANYYIHADEYIVNKVVEFNDNTKGALPGNGILETALLSTTDNELSINIKNQENIL